MDALSLLSKNLSSVFLYQCLFKYIIFRSENRVMLKLDKFLSIACLKFYQFQHLDDLNDKQ